MAGVEEFIDDFINLLTEYKCCNFPITIETDYEIKYKGSLIIRFIIS